MSRLAAIASGDEVLRYIPQRPPFVMVHAIGAVSEKSITTAFTVLADGVMTENGYLLEGGMIENIAQTAAALTGYHAVVNQTPVKTGFIGAVKRLKINGKPQVGDVLATTVEVVNEVFDYSIIKGTICKGDLLLAECEMTIFLQN